MKREAEIKKLSRAQKVQLIHDSHLEKILAENQINV